MDALIYISASLHSCLSSEAWSTEDHGCVLPSLSLLFSLSLSLTHIHTCILSVSLHLSCSLSTVRCVNTSSASRKAFRLGRVHPNYVDYYLEDTVVGTVTVTWLRWGWQISTGTAFSLCMEVKDVWLLFLLFNSHFKFLTYATPGKLTFQLQIRSKPDQFVSFRHNKITGMLCMK